MRRVRKLASDVADGFRTGLDILLWGRPYPRTVSLSALREMRHRSDEEPTT